MIFLAIIFIIFSIINILCLTGAWIARSTRSPLARAMTPLGVFAILLGPLFLHSDPNSLWFQTSLGWTLGGPLLLILLASWWTRNAYLLALAIRGEHELIKSGRNLPDLIHNRELGLDRMTLQAGLKESPDVLVHPGISTPIVLGTPPKILIPSKFVPPPFLAGSNYWDTTASIGASMEGLQGIIRHELIHIGNRDHVINLLHHIFYVLLGRELIFPENKALATVLPIARKVLQGLRVLSSPVRHLLEIDRGASEVTADGTPSKDLPTVVVVVILVPILSGSIYFTPGLESLRFSLTGKPIFWGYLPVRMQVGGDPKTNIRFGVERLPNGSNKVLFNGFARTEGDWANITYLHSLDYEGSDVSFRVSYHGAPPKILVFAQSKAIDSPVGSPFGIVRQMTVLPQSFELSGPAGWKYGVWTLRGVNTWAPNANLGPRAPTSIMLRVEIRGIGRYQLAVIQPKDLQSLGP